MTVLSKVVSGVKRRTTHNSDTASTLTSDTTRTKDTQPVAPDLRRFSDFMNPFPAVSPGGYTKYYQAMGSGMTVEASVVGGERGSRVIQTPSPNSRQHALPVLCELNNQAPPPKRASSSSSAGPKRPPPIQTSKLHQQRQSSKQRGPSSSSSSSSSTTTSRRSSATSKTQPGMNGSASKSTLLASIPESVSEPHPQSSSHKLRTPSGKSENSSSHGNITREHSGSSGSSGNSPHASLRRKKGRLLRTPSVERDFAKLGMADTMLKDWHGTRTPTSSGSPTASSPSSGSGSSLDSPCSACEPSTPSSLGRSSRAKPGKLEALNRAISTSSGSSTSTTRRANSDSSSTDSHEDEEEDEDALLTPGDSGVDVSQVVVGVRLANGDRFGFTESEMREFGKVVRRSLRGVAPPPSAFGRANARRYKAEEEERDEDDEDWEPFERPDSRSTYRTARTSFDDF